MTSDFLDFIFKSTDLVFKIIVVVVTCYIALKYLRTLTPCVNIEIVKQAIFEDYITVGIKISNVSKIGFYKDKILLKVETFSIFQLASLKSQDNLMLDEWINFKHSFEIFMSTKTIDPKEDLYIERLYKLKKEEALHIGVQVKIKRPVLSRILFFWWPYTYQWTFTKFIK